MSKQTIEIKCSDGYALAGNLYVPESDVAVKTAVMIAPATGIKRGFYHAFAQYLQTQGYGVITFDNRGIGGSLNGAVKESKATIRDWGYLDMPAAFDVLKQQFPDAHYHVVGHSAGGQLTGLMHNYADIRSQFNVACSSGQMDNMAIPFRWQGKFFLNIFAPISNLLFGCTNAQWMGMGEPLPSGVAREWAQWCNGAGYVATAFGKTVKEHWYDDIQYPSFWLNATDDEIANDKNVDDMSRIFTQSPITRLTLSPEEQQLKEIGHMKFFSSKSKVLWKLATDWLKQHK